MKWEKLHRGFYLRPTLTVAKDLLGKLLIRREGSELLIGKIVEVEAYLGERDPASHAYRGKTDRNAVMFGIGGHLYVYFTYGMHYCCNVVTERKGKGRAVLIRAIEPVSGIERMIRNRSASAANQPADRDRLLRWLCSGPAKTCQALGIARGDNGVDLCGRTIWLARRIGNSGPRSIEHSTRIGITAAREHRWRFTLRGNPYASK